MDIKEGRFLCAVDALKPDWHPLFDRYETTYHPLEEQTGLFFDFAALEPAEAEIQAFANRFGLLTTGDDHPVDSEFGPVMVHGESLEFWKEQVDAFRIVVVFWDAVLSGKRHDIEKFRDSLLAPQLPLVVQQRLHLVEEDPAMAVLSTIQRIVDSRLRERVEVRLLFKGNQPQLGGALMPQDLIGALWLQFAAAIDARKTFSTCRQCGTHFELSRDPETGKRRDSRYCTARCRVAHYRGRIEKAQQLKVKGLTPAQIARELGTQVRTVNGWLKGSGSDRAKE
jgi:hypothetical protein